MEPEKKLALPPINWFGGFMVARDLLQWTKGGLEPDEPGGYLDKMNRENWIHRPLIVISALQTYGPTLEAAQVIQGEGKGFFTDVSPEALVDKMEESVERLRKGGLWKFGRNEFGSLEFQKTE